MTLTETALKNPAGIGVAVAIVILFGLIAISGLPVQLFPNIERPQISINANWRAASPKEVEAQILEPIETVLQGLPGMELMEANAFNGGAWVNMQFTLGTDMQTTLMDVIGRLNRLPALPADADPPQVNMSGGGGGANESLTWFFVQLLPGTVGPVEDYQQLLLDTLRPRLEAIEGVAGVEINAGSDQELQIIIDPYRAAQFGISIPSIAAQAGRSNDVSGGFIDVGRRQYTLRFEGRYSPEQLSDMVLDWRNGSPVHLGDIADIQVARGKRQGFSIQNGNPAIGVQVLKSNGANALQALELVKAEVDILRDTVLNQAGLDIRQSFDASVFIKRAVAMVTTNLIFGVILAVGILWWFLRDRRVTIVIATAIPISLLTTVVVLFIAGRSLNVISLAGLAFAVGMVLDAAIVVSENILRHREQGETPFRSALLGAKQVQGALLASTATTVAIFIPVLFLEDVEGQLFADLALTIAIAVVVSLVVALTVLPAMAGNWLQPRKPTENKGTQPNWSRQLISRLMSFSGTPTRRWGLISGLIAGPLLLAWLLIPQLDYLPPVKRDAVDAFLNMPPGANVDTIESEVVNPIVERLAPYMAGEQEPALKNYYIIIWPGGGTIGARVQDQSRVKELENIMRDEILAGIPDFQGFAEQGNLFGGFGNGRDIALHLQSVDPEALAIAAQRSRDLLQQAFPGANVQMFPNVDGGQPEIRLLPRDERIVESGWDRPGVAALIRSFGNGQWLGEHFDGERRMDIIMRVGGWDTPEELVNMPIASPFPITNTQAGVSSDLTTLGNLVEVVNTTGPGQIRRVAGRRTITVSVSPPDDVSLETAVATIQSQVEPGIRSVLPADGALIYGGSADSLQEAIKTMGRNFLLAIVILFLLMSGLFRSAKDSLLVVLTIPLAAVGGVVALRLLNLLSFQPMDLLTMIGFIILLGLVVNNAILLVDQTRRAEREGLSRDVAVEQALSLRLRPIFMSTLTSIFGMMPLLLLPAEGSVIYRGLATAIVGGMACSLIFTLLLLPSLLRLGKIKQVESASTIEQPLIESVVKAH